MTSSSFGPLGVEDDRPLRAVDLPAHLVLAPEREPRRLVRPDRAVLELDGGLEGVVDVDGPAGPLLDERPQDPVDGAGLADEVAGLVDHVRAEVAEGAGAGDLLVEPPDLRELGIHDPLLVVAAAEVVDLAELARVDHLLREPDRGVEAVVERGHVLHARLGDRLPDLVALLGRPAERLLADHVLAGPCGRDRRLEHACRSARRCRRSAPPGRRRRPASSSTTSRSRIVAPPRVPHPPSAR